MTTKQLRFITTRQDHRIAALAALAISIHIIESAFPSPLPGIKPGLANVITLFTFIIYGWKTALQVSLLRVLISSLLLGTFLSPAFLLSLSGALLSLLSLCCTQLPFYGKFKKYQPGAVGYAIISAVSHMSGQFLVAWYFFIPHPGLFKLLPIFMTIAVILGLLSGIITHIILHKFTTSEISNLQKDAL